MTEPEASKERRIARRVPLALVVRVGGGTGAVYHTRDLSWDGVFLCTPRPLEVGEQMELALELGTGDTISAGALVTRTQIVQTVGEQPLLSGMAVRFTRLEPAERERLDRIVEGVWRILTEGGKLPDAGAAARAQRGAPPGGGPRGGSLGGP